MKRKVILTLGITFNLLIFVNSLMPANISSNQSGFITNIIYPIFSNIIEIERFSLIIRKLAHFTEFLLLSLIFGYIYTLFNLKYKYLIVLIHGLLTAITDEVIQIFIPGRAGMVTDVLIDFSGVLVGLFLFILINKIFKNEEEK